LTVIRRMQQADVERVASCARLADVEEMLAGSGHTIAEALQLGLEQSLRAWVIEQDGKPLAAVGDTMAGIGVGVPWMVTTDHIGEAPRPFLRASKAILADTMQRHCLLVNYVDARNATAIRWLGWLGFTIHGSAPYGRDGLPFHKFSLIRSK
jgi:hypothetical protein